MRIFQSHAKADGVDVATALGDQLLHHGQLQTFFDESDPPIGYDGEIRLDREAGTATYGTSAMIAVYTDTYTSRPWCQRELHAARTRAASVPVPVDGKNGRRWQNKPLLIVDALEQKRTRFLGETGYAPVIRWHPDKVAATIDLLLREILLSLYYQRWSRALPLEGGTHAFSGPLDLHVTLQIARRTAGELTYIVVPPPGPPKTARRWFRDLLGDVRIGTFKELQKAER